MACNSIKFYNFAVKLSISKKEMLTFLKTKGLESEFGFEAFLTRMDSVRWKLALTWAAQAGGHALHVGTRRGRGWTVVGRRLGGLLPMLDLCELFEV